MSDFTSLKTSKPEVMSVGLQQYLLYDETANSMAGSVGMAGGEECSTKRRTGVR